MSETSPFLKKKYKPSMTPTLFWASFVLFGAFAITAFGLSIAAYVKRTEVFDPLTLNSQLTVNDNVVVQGDLHISPSPGDVGPNDVGYVESTVTLTSGQSNLFTWYPIERGRYAHHLQSNLVSNYETSMNSFESGSSSTGSFEFRSRLNALKNATIKDGVYPLAIIVHGGPPSTLDDPAYPMAYARTAEHLASHGIIAVTYNRLSYDEVDAVDLSDVITYMHSSSQLSVHVNQSSTTVVGHSNGGFVATIVGGGWFNQNFTDTRVKGVVLIESIVLGDVPGTLVDMSVPVLCVGRKTISPFDGFFDYTDTMSVMTQANPRFRMHMDGASHATFETSRPDILNGLREQSLISNGPSANDPLIFPPQDDVTDPFTYFLSLDPAAAASFLFWNLPELLFGTPAFYPIEGLNVVPTSHVGVGSVASNSDTDGDGFADITRYLTQTALSGNMTTLQLPDTYINVNNMRISPIQYETAGHLVGHTIRIIDGEGTGQTRTISDWTGAPNYIATVSAPFVSPPNNTSVFIVTNQNGVFNRALDGTNITSFTTRLGADETNLILNHGVVAFIRGIVGDDPYYANFLTTDQTDALKSVGLSEFEIQNTATSKRSLAAKTISHNHMMNKTYMFRDMYEIFSNRVSSMKQK